MEMLQTENSHAWDPKRTALQIIQRKQVLVRMIDPSEVINYRKRVSYHDNVKLNRIDQQKK